MGSSDVVTVEAYPTTPQPTTLVIYAPSTVNPNEAFVIWGTLVDSSGVGIEGKTVAVYKNGELFATSVTDGNGTVGSGDSITDVLPSFGDSATYHFHFLGDTFYSESTSESATVTTTMEPECAVDADCGEGFVCQNGFCVKIETPLEFPWLIILGLAGALVVGGIVIYKAS